MRTEYLKQNIGRAQSVLLEEGEEYLSGYSQYYVKVYIKRSAEDKTGQSVQIIPTKLYNDGLMEE